MESNAKPLTGRARSLANLVPCKKGEVRNPSGYNGRDKRTITDYLCEYYAETVTLTVDGEQVEWPRNKVVARMMGRFVFDCAVKAGMTGSIGDVDPRLLREYVPEVFGRLDPIAKGRDGVLVDVPVTIQFIRDDGKGNRGQIERTSDG